MTILDKMMRMAGRGPDGTAKAIKTDENGNIGVQLINGVALTGAGKNLFNTSNITTGYGINVITGVSQLASVGDWYHSDYIPATSGNTIKFNDLFTTTLGTAFYKDGVFVSGISNADIIANDLIITVPYGVDSMRVTNSNSSKLPSTFQIENGTKTTTYEQYKNINYLAYLANILKAEIKGDIEALSGIGKNLFNLNTIKTGYTINPTSGLSEVTVGDWYHSDYIPVEWGRRIKFNDIVTSVKGTAFYKDGVFVSGISNADIIANDLIITVPYGVDSMRVSNNTLIPISTFQIEYGIKSTSYEIYRNVNYLRHYSEQMEKGISAEDVDKNVAPLTVEIDNDGRAVLRVVDSAPFAYDEALDAKKVKQIDVNFKLGNFSGNRTTSASILTWTIDDIKKASFLNIGITNNVGVGTYTIDVIFKGTDPYNPGCSFTKVATTFLEPVHAGAIGGFYVEVPVMGEGSVIIKLKSNLSTEWLYGTVYGRN